MKLDVKSAAAADAVVWGGWAIFLTGVANLIVTVQALWNVGTDLVLVPFAVISYALGDEAGAHEAIAA